MPRIPPPARKRSFPLLPAVLAVVVVIAVAALLLSMQRPDTVRSLVGTPASGPLSFEGPILGFDDIPGTLARPNIKIAQVSPVAVDPETYGRWAEATGVTGSPFDNVLFAGMARGDGEQAVTGRYRENGRPTGAVHMFCGPDMGDEFQGGYWTCLVHELVRAHQSGREDSGADSTVAEDQEAWAISSVVEAYIKGCSQYSCYLDMIAENEQYTGLDLLPLPETATDSLDYVTVLGWVQEIGNPVR